MKKTYKNPEIKIVSLQTAKLIAASTTMYGENATGPGMSRGSAFWDDEE